MNDDRLRQAYARHLATRAPDVRAGCVSPEALLALVERQGTEAERLATLDHAMACDACRRDLDLLRAVARAEPLAGARRFVRWFTPQLAAAAAVVLVVGAAAALWLRPGGEPAWRGAGEITLVSPVGAVPSGRSRILSWRAVPGTPRYEVELLTAAGDSVYAVALTDTTLVLPPGVLLTADREYLWSVRARLADGTQVASAARRFRLIPP